MSIKKILMLTTGGTIAGLAKTTTEHTHYQSAALAGGDLLALLPQPGSGFEYEHMALCALGSENFTPKHWHLIWGAIVDQSKRKDLAGIVVAHGTDTLEETALACSLMLSQTPIQMPIVFTGAMRPANALSSDGLRNLFDAVSVVQDEHAANYGAMVVFNEKLYAAWQVQKQHTTQLDAFSGGDYGCLANVANGCVRWLQSSIQRELSQLSISSLKFELLDSQWARVLIFGAYAGVDVASLQAMLASQDAGQNSKFPGVLGVVYAGKGQGTIANGVLPVLHEASQQGVIIVRASRVAEGCVLPSSDDVVHGFVAAGRLNPQKARVVLLLILNHVLSHEKQSPGDPRAITNLLPEIRRVFSLFGGG